MKITTISYGIAIVFIIIGCANVKQSPSSEINRMDFMEKNLTEMEASDPIVDFRAALARKDYRFVGIMGYTLDIPGIDENNVLVRNGGVKVIKGTSDSIVDKEDARLQKLARDYAIKYNHLLLKYLSENENNNKPDD
jgi:hypothetical protein